MEGSAAMQCTAQYIFIFPNIINNEFSKPSRHLLIKKNWFEVWLLITGIK